MKPHSFLWPFSIPYGIAVGVRNRLFDLGVIQSYAAGAPTISVGNLSAGGTGKTPFVLELIERIEKIDNRLSRKIAIISRGYGRSTKGMEIVSDGKRVVGDPFSCGDEPYMIAENARRSVVIVDENRLRGAEFAVGQLGVKVVILDDGFQHRRLKRDLDIVLLDGRNPLGNKLLLPAGFLREPVSSLARADLIVLSKSVGDDIELEERCRKMSELIGKPTVATRISPKYWKRSGKAEVEGLDQINGRRVAAFAGVANPGSFYEAIESIGGEIVSAISLPDHCQYGKFYVDKIAHAFTANRAEWLVTTEKDSVKLPPILKLLPLYFLKIGHEFGYGSEIIDDLIRKTIHIEKKASGAG